MCETDQRRTGATIQLNLRTLSVVLAVLLGLSSTVIVLILAVMAFINPQTELNLAVWLAGVVGVCMGLASLIIVGFVLTARMLAERVDANGRRIEAELVAHRQAFTGDVAAYREGVADGVARTVSPLAHALAEVSRPDNVVDLRPGDRDWASAN